LFEVGLTALAIFGAALLVLVVTIFWMLLKGCYGNEDGLD
jgi:hypothetical protein